MSVEREGEPVLNTEMNLADLVRRLESYYKIVCDHHNCRNGKESISDDEIDELYSKAGEIESIITSARAYSIDDIKLKAHAARMIADMEFGEDKFGDAIDGANAHEAIAMSVIWDLLQLDRPSDEMSPGRSSGPGLGGVAAYFMRPPVQR